MAGTTSPPISSMGDSGFKRQRYGRYVLIDRLGAGGMAEVFRALVIGPEDFQRAVVIKRILPHLNNDPNFVRMFIDEATLCGRLFHPNIIQVHEFGKQEGAYFIAMEYVHGRTLSSILGRLAEKSHRMPFTSAAEIIRQTCRGLGHAHALKSPNGKPLGIIHRDVTPANVIVAFTGTAKILDFGVARVAGELRTGSVTDAGQVKGKSSYLAPEQLRNGPIDARVDIFACGILLHEALSGRRLFKGSNPLQTMKLIQEMDIPGPSQINPSVPVALDEIVLRALRRDPADRYATAEEMAEALEAFLIGQRYSSQDLTRFLRDLFAGDTADHTALGRDEVRDIVRSVGVEEGAGPSFSASDPAPALVRPPTEESGTGPTDVYGEDLIWLTSPDSERVRLRKRKRMLVGAAAVGLVGLVGGMTWVFKSDRERAQTVTGAPPSGVRSEIAGAVRSSGESPPAVGSTVRISITSAPAEAQVFRGDDPTPLGTTPLAITVPRGSEAVGFRVTKPGYVSGDFDIVPDADKPALVTLAQVSPVPSGSGQEKAQPSVRKSKNQEKVRNAIPIDPFAN